MIDCRIKIHNVQNKRAKIFFCFITKILVIVLNIPSYTSLKSRIMVTKSHIIIRT